MSGCFAGADRADIECGNSQLVARVKLSAVRRLPRVRDLRSSRLPATASGRLRVYANVSCSARQRERQVSGSTIEEGST